MIIFNFYRTAIISILTYATKEDNGTTVNDNTIIDEDDIIISHDTLDKSQSDVNYKENAEYQMGVSCWNDDDPAAIDHFKKAAEEGCPSAIAMIGMCYQYDFGVEQDMPKALEYYKKAAELNDDIGFIRLGYYYRQNGSVDTAVNMFRKSAYLGNISALEELVGTLWGALAYGKKEAQQEAEKWVERCLSKVNPDDIESLIDLFQRYFKNTNKIYEKLKDLAEVNVDCCWCLYKEYKNNDDPQRFPLEDKIIKFGNVEYIRILAESYDEEKDYKKAVNFYQVAASLGDPISQFQMGQRYLRGIDVDVDKRKAFDLFEKCAQQGKAEAQYYLGVCYEHGTGVKKDINQAKEWYKKASDQNFSYAKERLTYLKDLDKPWYVRIFSES